MRDRELGRVTIHLGPRDLFRLDLVQTLTGQTRAAVVREALKPYFEGAEAKMLRQVGRRRLEEAWQQWIHAGK